MKGGLIGRERWSIRPKYIATKKDGRTTLKAPTVEELHYKIYNWVIEHENMQTEKPITLASMHDEFLEHKMSTTWSEATQTRNNSVWENYYSGTPVTTVPIESITLKDLKEWAYGLIREHNLTRKESLIDENVNIRTIQEYVGHKEARTTYNNYCFDRRKAERTKKLENARLGGVSVNDIRRSRRAVI